MAQLSGFILFIQCSLIVFCNSFEFPVDDESEFHPILERKHDRFEWTIFKAISSNEKEKNVITSPFSIKLLLSLLAETATPDVRAQLAFKVLPSVPPGPLTYVYYNKTLESLAYKSKNYQLDVSTKIYIDKELTPTKRFLEIAKSYFNTDIEKLDFDDRTKSAENINNWCSAATHGRITNITKPTDLETTVALLVNAIYFKGTWQDIFPSLLTRPRDFKVNSEKTVQVPMMANTAEYYYIKTERFGGAQIVRLPYKGGQYAMTIILPNDPQGLDYMISSIKPGELQYLQYYFEKEIRLVIIPKFKFESTLHMRDTIAEVLNIPELFDLNTSLPGLGTGFIKISNIIQKAGIIVDEKGTEIYAETDIDADSRISAIPKFEANHPFLFVIEDESSGTLLFAGKVTDPSA